MTLPLTSPSTSSRRPIALSEDARLSNATLDRLPAGVQRPAYDRAALQPGILHLGLGAFHRAHQAVASDAALEAGDPRWGIAAVAMRSRDLLTRLRAQDGLYSVMAGDGESEETRVVGALCRLWHLQDDRAEIMALVASPVLQILTLTVTEKGYGHVPGTGRLDPGNPAVAQDLAGGMPAQSIPGLLCDILARRARTNLPLTVLCCDNMETNGRTLAALVHEMAAARAPQIQAWIAENVRFPSSMVDRIVPAATAETQAAAAARLGLSDRAPLATEAFSQWVIEDDFATPRPDWERAGVTFVADIAPWQRMKLALLNGPHSAIAYLGQMLDLETVDASMADPLLSRFVRALMEAEILPAISVPAGADANHYIDSLLKRFANPGLHHRTEQIAMDGSQKIPVRWVPVIEASLAAGHLPRRLCFCIAVWCRYLAGRSEAGRALTINDPLGDSLRATLADAQTPGDAALALLARREVFPVALAENLRVAEEVRGCAERIAQAGLRAALAGFSQD